MQSSSESSVLQELREYTEQNVGGADMLSGILVGRLLYFLVKASRAKCVLDLGTFTGYSALTLAEALGCEGKVMTCDQSAQHLKIARSFFAKAKAGSKIEVFEGKVRDCIDSLSVSVDLAFIDADKMHLIDYVNLLYPKLVTGGFILIDNALWRGEVLNPHEKRAEAIAEFNDFIKKDVRFTNVLLPIRDGLNIIFKN